MTNMTDALPPTLLLHCCCAPCSGALLERLLDAGATVTLFFYNPNIHPRAEYERRKAEIRRYAEKRGVPFVDADYDPENWFARVRGLESEPERGARCQVCFDMRMERAALYLHETGGGVFATSLGLSRRKRLEQVNGAGRRAAARYPEVRFLDANWRKKGGAEDAVALARQEGFYRQTYCGCVFSSRRESEKQPDSR